MQLDSATRRHLEIAIDDLALEFAGVFSRDTIARYIDESLDELSGVRFGDFVPILSYRFARERLRAAGQAAGTIEKTVPEVLFVCVQNAGRSQMAAALLRHRSEGRIDVRSAGSAPAGSIHPEVAEALAELGLDVNAEYPKPLKDEFVAAADVVITMGCGDACPVYPGKRYEDWEVEDPAGKDAETVRRIRDEIDARVRALVKDLSSSTAA